jgi:hypothetical protein
MRTTTPIASIDTPVAIPAIAPFASPRFSVLSVDALALSGLGVPTIPLPVAVGDVIELDGSRTPPTDSLPSHVTLDAPEVAIVPELFAYTPLLKIGNKYDE